MTLKRFALKVLQNRYEYVFTHLAVEHVSVEVIDGTKVDFSLCNDMVFIAINGFETGKPKVNIRNPLNVNKCITYFDKEIWKVRQNKPPYNVRREK